MKIAICDNEAQMTTALKNLIMARYPNYEIDCYTAIEAFLQSDPDLPYDLILMDIVFENGSGIHAAAKYQAIHPAARVIFVTAYSDKFAQDIFVNVAPSGYLYKPVDAARLYALLADADSKIHEQRLRIHPIGSSYTEILQHHILYIESDKRIVRIFTQQQQIECYEKLDAIQARLSDSFNRCHKSYVVNLNKVASLDGKQFVLYNDVCIPISQARLRDARAAYFRLLGMQLR